MKKEDEDVKTVWTMKEGSESYGSIRGGLGKEKVRFQFNLDQGGYYYFVCSLPDALNLKGSFVFEKLELQKRTFFQRLTDSGSSRFSANVRIRVWNDFQQIFEKKFNLDMKKSKEQYTCFEVPSGFVPCSVQVQLRGHSFFKKLYVAASLYRWGKAPKNIKDSKIAARMGQYLLTRTMNVGHSRYESLVEKAESSLIKDLQELESRGAISRQSSISSRHSRHSLQSSHTHESAATPTSTSGPQIFEISAKSTIGDAMFYLLEKGVLSCPVWDEDAQEYLGLFDITDAMHFTLKLRDLSHGRSGKRREGQFYVHGVKISTTETSSWYGLDLPVSTFFSKEENKDLAPWVYVGPATSMKKVLQALQQVKRICVIDKSKKVVKVISQSEIISQVFHRYIAPNLEPKKKEYFLTTELNEDAVYRGIKTFSLNDTTLQAFRAIMTSNSADAVPVVDDKGALVASIEAVDAWFICRTEMEENMPIDLSRLSLRDFLDEADAMAELHLAKSRKEAVPVYIDTPLKDIIAKLVQFRVHGVYVVDKETNAPLGRINVTDIVRALLEDEVGIFKMGENVQSIFLWDLKKEPHRPSVSDVVKAAAARSRNRKEKRAEKDSGDGFVLVDKDDVVPLSDDAATSSTVSSSRVPSPTPGSPQLRRHGSSKVYKGSARPTSDSSLPPIPPSISTRSRSRSTGLYRFGGPPNKDSVVSPERLSELEEHLPTALSGALWTSCFHMRRDGASSLAIRDLLRHRSVPLMILLEDSNGYAFGGFLPSGVYLEADQSDHGYIEGPSGDGESFVFTFGHKSSLEPPKVFHWTQRNRLFRLLSAEEGFGMGGGGEGFAFYVDNLLTNGSSSRSDTYDNDTLASSSIFTCINMEIFALTNIIRIASPRTGSPSRGQRI